MIVSNNDSESTTHQILINCSLLWVTHSLMQEAPRSNRGWALTFLISSVLSGITGVLIFWSFGSVAQFLEFWWTKTVLWRAPRSLGGGNLVFQDETIKSLWAICI